MLNNESNYSIIKDNAKKSVRIDINGFFGPNDVTEYLKDYQSLKKSIDVKSTTLILNGKDLKAFPNEVEATLAELYKDYSTFKKVYITAPSQFVTKMQVQRVLKSNNLAEHFEFIENVEDIK